MIILGVIREEIASKLEKIGPIFFMFQSISILAIRRNRLSKQSQYRKIVLITKPDH